MMIGCQDPKGYELGFIIRTDTPNKMIRFEFVDTATKKVIGYRAYNLEETRAIAHMLNSYVDAIDS
jgi:hypothetical protein